MKTKDFYRRDLPHWQPKDGIFNICFRLEGTIPQHVIRELQEFRETEKSKILGQTPHLSEIALKLELAKVKSLYFGKFDDILDQGYSDIEYLKQPEIAAVVGDAIMYWHEKKYEVICYCIMPNHVHLMLSDCQDQLFRLLQSVKKFSARKCNAILDRTGKRFWKKESYDNLVRGNSDLVAKALYILQNPVKAKLTDAWYNWPYTYLNPGYEKMLFSAMY